MSGDVQPRKRKDKKKKKDDLGIEEPRGTAAVFGEGDVFMHSQHEHGTGGHWCAKIIFFSLLAVLITLIGLIILENRGLTELEANQVESRYSGVLEGWLEDAPDDDHHDEHTLDLKHHDDEDDHGSELEHDDEEDEHHDDDEDDHHDEDDDDEGHNDEEDEDHDDDDEDEESQQVDEADDDEGGDDENDEVDNDADDDDEQENEDDDEQADEDDDEDNEGKSYQEDSVEENDDDDEDEQNLKSAEDEDEEEVIVQKYKSNVYAENDDDDDDDDQQKEDDDDEDEVNTDNDDEDVREDDEDEEETEEPEEDTEVEVEHIEKEVTDDDVISNEEPETADDNSQEVSKEATPVDVDEDDDVEFLEPDELDELPEVLPIPVPKGKPLAEVEDTRSTEKPHDTLAEEEEYEKQQEALRKEKEESSQGLWLKLTVGGALMVATHAVLRRVTAPRETEEPERSREETPLADRRMTLIPEPPTPLVTPKVVPEVTRPIIEREVVKQAPVVTQPPTKEELEEEEEEEEDEVVIIKSTPETLKDMIDKELYSDEEEMEEEEEIEEDVPLPKPAPIVKPAPILKPPPIIKQAPVKPPSPVAKEPSPEPEIEEDDDVEIIDDEQLEEEVEEEEDEDEISDVDDAELLTRLEAKYGRLPEPERPGARKDGGNSIEDMWPGEPSDPFWSDQLDQAEQDLRQGEWSSAEKRASVPELKSSGRARYILARALDSAAEAKRDNRLLTRAITAYLDLLKMNEQLSDKKLLEVTNRTLERIKFRGMYLSAEPVYKLLIRRFPNDVNYRNNLTVSLLMANRADLAENVLKDTLKLWPNDKLALAHYGFVLKTLHNKLEEAVEAFMKALEGDTGPACEPRFYYHLGDALLLLGRFAEAHEIHKRGAAKGHFLSPAQRSLYNVERLKSQPWWNIQDTPYIKLARALEKSWKDILKEGEAAKKLYEKEKEGLKERGEWSQLDLFVRGREVPNRCSRAPVTCGIVRNEIAASGCRRGQIKFSAMEAGTHVRPHVGPTNCRLRMHLGLSNTKDTYIRVDKETRQWQTGKVLMFDDSFEHEVWHNGTGSRLVLIVDVWHPDLTPAERRQLPAI